VDIALAQDESIQILIDLGLTLLQAKVYLTLTQTQEASVKTVSKIGKIARQDVYRIMPSLEKLGLAEKIVAKPIMYRATPIKEGFYLLLQKKTTEQSNLERKTLTFIKKLHEKTRKKRVEEQSYFLVVSSEPLYFKTIARMNNEAQTSIDIMGKWEIVKKRLFYRFNNLKDILRKGVEIRIITEENEGNKSIQEIIQTLKNIGSIRIKYLRGSVPIRASIQDRKYANLWIGVKPDNLPRLFSNNPYFVEILADYFERIWDET
jgi:sugar-specific transcriptional regulator TrmB